MPLTAAQIATATGCPIGNVEAIWPLVVAALEEQGIRSDLVEVGTAATIAVETGIFLPIREKRAKRERQPDLWALQERYWPSGYYGRGLVQETWWENYHKDGKALGIDLVGNPDKALEFETSARILALRMKASGAAAAADGQDWRRVRRKINGGYTAWNDFNAIVCRMLEVLGV